MSPYIEKALNIDQDLKTDIQLYIVYSPTGGGGVSPDTHSQSIPSFHTTSTTGCVGKNLDQIIRLRWPHP